MPNPTQASEAGSGPSMNPVSEPTLPPQEAPAVPPPPPKNARIAAAGRDLARRAVGAARKTPRWAWAGICGSPRLFHHARNLTTDVLLALVLIGFAFVSWRTLTDDDLSIHPISVPEEYAKSGYTGEVAAGRLREALLALADYQHSDALLYGGTFTFPLISDPGRATGIPNVEVHGVGLSFTQLVAQIRDAIGLRTRRITGDLVRQQDRLCLGVKFASLPDRSDIPRVEICTSDVHNPDDLIERAAQLVMLDISPEFALRYPPRERSVEVTRQVNQLADRLGRSPNREDRALSYEISALNYWYRSREPTYAIRELERATALNPNSRRVVMLQTFRFIRDTEHVRSGIEAAKKSPDRDARLAALVGLLERLSKAHRQTFEDAAEKHAVKDANSEALAGIIHSLIATHMHRAGQAMHAPAKSKPVIAAAEQALAAGLARTARANRPVTFDYAMMASTAAILGDREAVRRLCRRIEELNATGHDVVGCLRHVYSLHRGKAREIEAATAAYGNLLDRYIENYTFHLPRRREATTRISLRDRIESFRKREERRKFYESLFTLVDADEMLTILEQGLVSARHEALLHAPPDMEHGLVLRKMTVWLLAELECHVQNSEDDAALLNFLAAKFRGNGLSKSADGTSARAMLAREASLAAQPGRNEPKKAEDDAAAGDARKKREEELAAARKRADDWQKLRCDQMTNWRRHTTINRMPLGIAQ